MPQTASRGASSNRWKSRIARLLVLKAEPKRMIVQCRGRKVADCRVIEVLADHAHCMTEHHPGPASLHAISSHG
jgi:hypothetical protein